MWWLFIKKTQERNNEWGRNKNENKYEENLVLHDMKHAVECHAILLLLFTWRMIELNFPPHLTLFFSKCSTDFIFTSTDQTFILFDSTIVSGFKFEGFIDVFSLMAISSKQEFCDYKNCESQKMITGYIAFVLSITIHLEIIPTSSSSTATFFDHLLCLLNVWLIKIFQFLSSQIFLFPLSSFFCRE